MYLRRYSGHVPLHRLWSFATRQGDLVLPEHAHILDCEECRLTLRACLNSESFGSVLLELKSKDDTADRTRFDFQQNMGEHKNHL